MMRDQPDTSDIILPDYPVVKIACDQIEWPTPDITKRKRNPEFAEKLAETSIRHEGQHHPILVIDNPDSKAKRPYIGKSGWHRWYGIKHTLKLPTVKACVVTGADPDMLEAIEMSPNLWSNPLSKAQQSVCLAKLLEIHERRVVAYEAKKRVRKEAQADNARAAAHGKTDDMVEVPEAPEKPPHFVASMAQQTGQSQTSVKRSLKIGKAFTSEEARILDENGITQQLMETIASLPPEQRSEVVSLIASGLEAEVAIGNVTGQDEVQLPSGQMVPTRPEAREQAKAEKEQAKADRKEQNQPTKKADRELSDDEWLTTHCGSQLADIPEPCRQIFRYEALVYRRTKDMRLAFNTKALPIIDEARTQKRRLQVGILGIIGRLMGIEHPKNWLVCGGCDGRGTKPGSSDDCSDCHRQEFKITFIPTKKVGK